MTRYYEARLAASERNEITAIVRDVTDRVEAQKEKEKMEAQLRQSQKLEAIGTLAGGIAHDFTNVLTSIMGFSTLVEEELPQNSPQRAPMREILTASERARSSQADPHVCPARGAAAETGRDRLRGSGGSQSNARVGSGHHRDSARYRRILSENTEGFRAACQGRDMVARLPQSLGALRPGVLGCNDAGDDWCRVGAKAAEASAGRADHPGHRIQ